MMGRKDRGLCTTALICGLLAITLIGCGSNSGPADRTHAGSDHGFVHHGAMQANKQRERARARDKGRERSRARARRGAARRAEVATGDCPPRGKVLDGVYHPDRLTVRDPCRKVTGTVDDVRDEEDGDIHVLVRLGHQYDGMLMANNRSEQNGDLVVEFMPRDYGHLPRPSIGDRLMLVGAYVNDTEHSWAELHPVWAVSIDGGPVERSGPQFGGSPAYAMSSNALATCHTEKGGRCHGYNGEVAPPPDDEGPTHAGNGSGSGGGSCTPGYSPCIPPGPDVDCAGGGGDGPRYVRGPVKVTGSDPYDLDANSDGIACD